MNAKFSGHYITISLGITNCFLIACHNGYLLVDTSLEKYYDRFRKELTDHAVELKQIRYIFLTHHHTDHTGFLASLLRDTGAVLIVHKNALPFVARGINNDNMVGTTALIRFFMLIKKLFRMERTNEAVVPDEKAVIIESDNNEILRSFGIPAGIKLLPGHTADSIAIIDDDGNAFIGDAAVNILGVIGLKNRPLVSENPGAVFECWKKIRDENGKQLFVSHGKPLHINELLH